MTRHQAATVAQGLLIVSGALLVGEDPRWALATSIGLVCAALNAPTRYWSTPSRAHLGWVIGLGAIAAAVVSLAQTLQLSGLAAMSLGLALAAAPHELAVPPQRARAATTRLMAHATIILFIQTGPDWRVLMALSVGLAASTTLTEPAERSEQTTSLARLTAGALGLALSTIALSLLPGAVTPATPLIPLIGGGLAVASLLVELKGVRSAVLADTKRDWLLRTTVPCAEIDGDGNVQDFNDAWNREFGQLSMVEQVGARAWTVVLAAFVEARLGGETVARELTVPTGPAMSDVFSVELTPSSPAEGTCLMAVRVDRGRPNMAEVDQLHRQSVTDQLTGLLNRRGMELELTRRLKRDETWVVYADLDGFKAVNDSLGHQAGDEVLGEVAVRLLGFWRHDDAIARVGGDEFVVLTHSQVSPRRMLDCTDALTFDFRGHRISVSLGLSRGAAGTGPAALLNDADRSMYQIKRRRKAMGANVGPSGRAAADDERVASSQPDREPARSTRRDPR